MILYTISLRDIRKYLASLEKGESVGTPGFAGRCLVAKAIQHKYLGIGRVVVGPRSFGVIDDELIYPLTTEVGKIVAGFDLFYPESHVTRAMVEDRMPELQQ